MPGNGCPACVQQVLKHDMHYAKSLLTGIRGSMRLQPTIAVRRCHVAAAQMNVYAEVKPWTCVHLYHRCCVAQSEQLAGHLETIPTCQAGTLMIVNTENSQHCSPGPTCQAPWRGAETSPPQPLLWPTPAVSPEPLLLMPALPPAVPAGGALAVGTAPAVETTTWLICPTTSSQLAQGPWHTGESTCQ